MMIRIIENIQDFDSVKHDCNRLADSFEMPLLRYEWLINCAKVIPPGTSLFIIIYYSDGRVRAIAPLVLVKNIISERLEMLGSSLHNEPTGFLYEDEDSLIELLKAIMETGKTFFINKIRGFSTESLKIEQMLEETKNLTSRSFNAIPYLPISGTHENFQRNISADRKSSLKRLLKIAGSMGNPSIEITCPLPEDVEQYMDEVFETEASGWKKRMGTAMKINNRLGTFFMNYASDAVKLQMLRLSFLRIDGVAIAVQVGIIHSNRYWVLKIGYDEKWAKCSPGVLLMNEVIGYAFSSKLDAIEFLGSNEKWLHIWTKQFHNTFSLRIFNSNFSFITDTVRTNSSYILSKLHSIAARRHPPIKDIQNA